MHYTQQTYEQMDRVLSNSDGWQERSVFDALVEPVFGSHPRDGKTLRTGLDVGTVTGLFPEWLAVDYCDEAWGLNNDPVALDYVRNRGNEFPSNCHFIQGDIRALPFDAGSIDFVTVMSGTFSHLPTGSHIGAITELARVIPHGRYLVISDWNMHSPIQDFLGLPYDDEAIAKLREQNIGWDAICDGLQNDFIVNCVDYFVDGRMYMIMATRS